MLQYVNECTVCRETLGSSVCSLLTLERLGDMRSLVYSVDTTYKRCYSTLMSALCVGKTLGSSVCSLLTLGRLGDLRSLVFMRHYPNIQEIVYSNLVSALCMGNPFQTVWLECVHFADARKAR